MATKKKPNAGRPLIGSSHKKGIKKDAGAKPKAGASKTGSASKSSAERPSKPKASRAGGTTKKPAKVGASKTRAGAKPSPRGVRASAAAGRKEPLRRISVPTGTEPARATKPRRVTEVRSEPSEEASKLALAIATAAIDKKALNVQILDVVGRVDYADYLVLMSGRSDRHVLAVADAIEEHLLKLQPKRKPSAVEGRPQGNWVVLDFNDVVAHVFQESARSHYDLDSFWQDARRVPLAPEAQGPGSDSSSD